MPKLYFENESAERCFELQHFDDLLERPFSLFEAVPDTLSGFFFCRAVFECAEEGCCGRICDDYSPKNGKSGICRHKGALFTPGKEVTFN